MSDGDNVLRASWRVQEDLSENIRSRGDRRDLEGLMRFKGHFSDSYSLIFNRLLYHSDL